MAELETAHAGCACCDDDCGCATAQPPELPIACTLDPAEQADRAELARGIGARSLLAWAETDRGASMRFEAQAESDLRSLIAAESQCCAFLEFDLRRDGDELLLSVEGPEEARPLILALFEPAP